MRPIDRRSLLLALASAAAAPRLGFAAGRSLASFGARGDGGADDTP